MIVREMDLSQFMTYAKHIEGDKLRKRKIGSLKGLVLKVYSKIPIVVKVVAFNKAKGHPMLQINDYRLPNLRFKMVVVVVNQPSLGFQSVGRIMVANA